VEEIATNPRFRRKTTRDGREIAFLKNLLQTNRAVGDLSHSAKQGETDMGDKGKKDKGRREQQKKAQLSPKEKRKLKKEKKNR